mmetsp:Transcript_19466/g.30467  ORF Transcript_19466/g.30467 Transcript_19466/m.30467 type:complete len:289 (+) Transcript_19466:449-1315(+)|eukprot:CAMPEP_0184296350 /NCGR_PEP_ID=MMETSP1049-20130417/7335_1 /TAXON_ID=77928 /ORGANISM="Proteomonas sulcata, Strain CCMP704" /LENGTH=288 /DNA_ID=CAMNT_0026605543 /DNA_START=206 /DNA_END=1072 /DNA_ORIENTATION=+
MLEAEGKTVICASSRMENRESVAKELDEHKPTRVLVASGLTGRPNVDWCETNKEATIRVNVNGSLNLADLCSARNIHMTLFATGCIYSYDDAHPIGGPGFLEEDPPNFSGSFYSKTKGMVEDLLTCYPTVLILRLRMPISDDLSNRSFVTKIAKYEKVVDIPNSMSTLPHLLPLSLAMANSKLTGIYNFVNPGVISHNEVLTLYKKHVDPNFEWINFSLEEQSKILAAPRSNNKLDTTKLEAAAKQLGLPLVTIQEGVEECMKRARAKLEEDGMYPQGLPKKLGPGNN